MRTAPRSYRILHPIGKGGFGTVYRAQMKGDGGFSKDVAIKLLNTDVDAADEVARRQRDEARILGLIRHRAILQVDGLVRLNGGWAVVMEYIDGVDLRDLLRLGSVPASCALQIVGEVAGALYVAWKAEGADGQPLRIIHRDIKPANIQLTRAGEVKLLDFGAARADFDSREAETVGYVLGTLRYMAPERLDGIDGPAGDIYALGVVLVELLTRQTMSKTSSNPDRHAANIETAVKQVTDVIGENHHDILELIRSMLAYHPEDRPRAKQLERTAWGIASAHYPTPRLQEWASRRVEQVQQHRRQKIGDDELSGETLMEQSQSMMYAYADDKISGVSVAGRSLPSISFFGMLLMGAASSVLLIALVWVLAFRGQAQRITPPERVEIPDVVTGSNRYPLVYRERDGRVEIDRRGLPALMTDRGPEQADHAVAIPDPEPLLYDRSSDPPTMGEVTGDGDAVNAILIGPSGRYTIPGFVPLGTYNVFYNGAVVLKGVRVQRGKRLDLFCDASVKMCLEK